MAKNVGTLLTAAARPNDSLDLIATAFANEIKGGYHSYATIAERNAIITARREWDMACTVYNDGLNTAVYKLKYNKVDTDINNNANWDLFVAATTGAFIPLAGTGVGAPVTGPIEFNFGVQITAKNGITPTSENYFILGGGFLQSSNGTNGVGFTIAADVTGVNLFAESNFPVNLNSNSGNINLLTNDGGNINLSTLFGGNINFGNRLLNLNSTGTTSTGSGVGVNVIENNVATAYFKTTTDRNGWSIKSPATTGVIDIKTPANSYIANLPNKTAASSQTFAMLSDLTGFSSGSVTSVGLSTPSIFTATDSPVTTSGTLGFTLNSQTQNTVFAAPNSASGTPTFRSLVAADIPLTSTRIAFGSASNKVTESTNLTWDNTNKILQFNGYNIKYNSNNTNFNIGLSNFSPSITGYGNIAIGSYTSEDATSTIGSTAVGFFALRENTDGYNNVAFGHSALRYNVNGYNNNGFGAYSLQNNINGSNNIGFGYGCNTSTSSASNELVIGSESAQILRVYFGSGGSITSSFNTQASVNFYLTPAKGLNQTGGSFIINGGQSTGSAIGGSVVIATASAGTSGTTVGALINRVIIDQLGHLTLNGQKEFRFNNSANTFYTSLKAGNNTANLNLTLPIADGTNGQVLSTNGAGVLSFITISAGGGGTITSVSGTTNRITSTGGTTPAIDIAANYVGQTSITTLGTIGTGVWNGSAITDTYIASQAVWNAKLSNITGLVTQGTNITVTGSGTSGSPYVINASAGAEPYTTTAYTSSLTFDVLNAREKNFDVTGFNGNLTIGYSNIGNGAVSSVRLNKTSASALTVTLPTVTNIICNTPDCVVSGDVITITSATGTKYIISTTKVGSDLIAIVNRVDQDENYGGGSTITLTTIGSTPNANAATITSSVLNLQPANELFGGVLTTIAQKIAGDKTLAANGANATSAATQKLSYKLALESSLWNGASESKNTFELYNKASTIINSTSFITTAYNGTDIFRMNTTGNTWYLPNFATNNLFSIVCEATDKKLMSIDSVDGRIVIGYDSISPTPDTGNIDYIVIGNKNFNNLDNSSPLELFDKSIIIGNNIRSTTLTLPRYMPNNSVLIGHDIDLGVGVSPNSVSGSIIIGNSNTVKLSTGVENSILIANGGSVGYINTFQAGSRTSRMTDIYFGGGKFDTITYTISGCNASDSTLYGFSTQTDTAGGSIIFRGGWSTGTAIPGALDFDSYLQTQSTGINANTTQTNILRVQNNNIALFGKNANYEYGTGQEVLYWNKATTNPTTNPTNGAIFYVDNADKLPKYRDINGFTITL